LKVYKTSKNHTTHTLYVQPGIHYPENSEWMGEDNKPKLFQVSFKNGVAEVEDNLAHYLIDKQMAKSSPIITLSGTVL
jgi:hypothetical protein